MVSEQAHEGWDHQMSESCVVPAPSARARAAHLHPVNIRDNPCMASGIIFCATGSTCHPRNKYLLYAIQ